MKIRTVMSVVNWQLLCAGFCATCVTYISHLGMPSGGGHHGPHLTHEESGLTEKGLPIACSWQSLDFIPVPSLSETFNH